MFRAAFMELSFLWAFFSRRGVAKAGSPMSGLSGEEGNLEMLALFGIFFPAGLTK
jgi:hypothetical protein